MNGNETDVKSRHLGDGRIRYIITGKAAEPNCKIERLIESEAGCAVDPLMPLISRTFMSNPILPTF